MNNAADVRISFSEHAEPLLAALRGLTGYVVRVTSLDGSELDAELLGFCTGSEGCELVVRPWNGMLREPGGALVSLHPETVRELYVY